MVQSATDFLSTRDVLYSLDRHHKKVFAAFLILIFVFSGRIHRAYCEILFAFYLGIGKQLFTELCRWQDKRKLLCTYCSTRVRVYYDAKIRSVKPDSVKGMEVDVEFDQVPRARNMSAWKRKQHWRDFRALKEGGALLTLIDAEQPENMNVVSLQISKRSIDPVANDSTEVVCNLVSDTKRAMITHRLTNSPSEDDFNGIISLPNNQQFSNRPMILVEFPAPVV